MIQSTIDDIKQKYHQGNSIIKLIMINVGIHVGLALLYVPIYLFAGPNTILADFISNWLCFPSNVLEIPIKIWTIFTYMFLHMDFLHLFFNMLIMYVLGTRLNDWLDNKHIVPIYIWGGVVGALFFAIGLNIFPVFDGIQNHSNIRGASAGVMAIVLATATLSPTATIRLFLIPLDIQIRYIAFFFVFTDFAISLTGDNAGGALAHLGGAFMGWMYIIQLRKGNDWSLPIHRIANLLSFRKKNKHYNKKNKTKVAPKKNKAKASKKTFKATMNIYKGSKGSQRSDYYGNEYGHSFIQKYKDMSQEECLNSILEKIKRSGYDSLSEDEKVFLNRYN